MHFVCSQQDLGDAAWLALPSLLRYATSLEVPVTLFLSCQILPTYLSPGAAAKIIQPCEEYNLVSGHQGGWSQDQEHCWRRKPDGPRRTALRGGCNETGSTWAEKTIVNACLMLLQVQESVLYSSLLYIDIVFCWLVNDNDSIFLHIFFIKGDAYIYLRWDQCITLEPYIFDNWTVAIFAARSPFRTIRVFSISMKCINVTVHFPNLSL